MTRRIHVVGSSPRTGTTLLTELLVVGFEIEAFANHERSIFREPKVPCDVYLSKNPPDVRVAAPLLALDPDLFVLHMVRDPRDVVVSVHERDPDAYWTDLRRWKRYRRGARRAEGSPRFLTIRYEDLVREPDAVQDEIAHFLPFLKRRAAFSEFHQLAAPPALSVEALGGVRPVAATSIGRWREHKPRLAAQLLHGSIDRDLAELSYEPDASWRRELLGVEPDAGRTHLVWPAPWTRLSQALTARRQIAAYARRRRRAQRRGGDFPAAAPGPFAIDFVTSDGVRLEVGRLGTGVPVLLLPGEGGAGTEQFAELAQALADAGFRAVALNPRWVGASRGPLEGLTLHDLADDAARVIAQVGAPAHVVGRAFGNRVARCLAADHPDAVRSLTLLAAGGLVPPLRALDPGRRARERKRWRAAAAAQRHANRDTPIEDWWDGGRAQMLVVQGLEDDIAPPENGRTLARDHPDRVKLVEIEDADHAVLAQRPDAVVPAIVSFLRSLETRE